MLSLFILFYWLLSRVPSKPLKHEFVKQQSSSAAMCLHLFLEVWRPLKVALVKYLQIKMSPWQRCSCVTRSLCSRSMSARWFDNSDTHTPPHTHSIDNMYVPKQSFICSPSPQPWEADELIQWRTERKSAGGIAFTFLRLARFDQLYQIYVTLDLEYLAYLPWL